MAGLEALILKDGDRRWKAAGRSPKQDKTPEKRRNKVLLALDNTIEQLRRGEENPKRGWYTTKPEQSTNGTLVRCTVRLGSRAIMLPKVRDDHFFATSLTDAVRKYEVVRNVVAAGDLDGPIADTLKKKSKA